MNNATEQNIAGRWQSQPTWCIRRRWPNVWGGWIVGRKRDLLLWI